MKMLLSIFLLASTVVSVGAADHGENHDGVVEDHHRKLSLPVCDGDCCGTDCNPTCYDKCTGVKCDDGKACTEDYCDSATGRCVFKPINSKCNNGLFCDGVEKCDPCDTDADADGCVSGAPPDCDDKVDCTVDSCDEDKDECVNEPDNTKCDNGLFCDGEETCDRVQGCLPGVPPDCDDKVDCTVDSCDEDKDECVNEPDNTKCDNGLFCDGEETCDRVQGCLPGAPVDCNDYDDCTEDSCDEDNDKCVNKPIDYYYIKCGKELDLCGISEDDIMMSGNGYVIGPYCPTPSSPGCCNTGAVDNVVELPFPDCLNEMPKKCKVNGAGVSNYGTIDCLTGDCEKVNVERKLHLLRTTG